MNITGSMAGLKSVSFQINDFISIATCNVTIQALQFCVHTKNIKRMHPPTKKVAANRMRDATSKSINIQRGKQKGADKHGLRTKYFPRRTRIGGELNGSGSKDREISSW